MPITSDNLKLIILAFKGAEEQGGFLFSGSTISGMLNIYKLTTDTKMLSDEASNAVRTIIMSSGNLLSEQQNTYTADAHISFLKTLQEAEKLAGM